MIKCFICDKNNVVSKIISLCDICGKVNELTLTFYGAHLTMYCSLLISYENLFDSQMYRYKASDSSPRVYSIPPSNCCLTSTYLYILAYNYL